MTYQITRNIAVSFITRDAHLKGTGGFLRPVSAVFSVRLSCYALNFQNYVISPHEFCELEEVVQGAFNNKVVLGETDQWLDEICALASFDVVNCIVLPNTTMESWCGLLKLESERWLFEMKYNSRVA
jgi:hypothetical protein